MSYSLKKKDIDPSEFSDEQLRDIIFGAVWCAKAMEQLAEDEQTLRVAYNVIKHFDDIPHERTHSDFVLEQARKKFS